MAGRCLAGDAGWPRWPDLFVLIGLCLPSWGCLISRICSCMPAWLWVNLQALKGCAVPKCGYCRDFRIVFVGWIDRYIMVLLYGSETSAHGSLPVQAPTTLPVLHWMWIAAQCCFGATETLKCNGTSKVRSRRLLSYMVNWHGMWKLKHLWGRYTLVRFLLCAIPKACLINYTFGKLPYASDKWMGLELRCSHLLAHTDLIQPLNLNEALFQNFSISVSHLVELTVSKLPVSEPQLERCATWRVSEGAETFLPQTCSTAVPEQCLPPKYLCSAACVLGGRVWLPGALLVSV